MSRGSALYTERTNGEPTATQYRDADRLLRDRMVRDADSRLALLRCWITDERERRWRERSAGEVAAAIARRAQVLVTYPADPDPTHSLRLTLTPLFKRILGATIVLLAAVLIVYGITR